MQKSKVLRLRIPAWEAFINALWLVPFIALATCVRPGLWVYFAVVAVEIIVEAGFSWFLKTPLAWKQLILGAFLGGLLGLGLANLIWPAVVPYCPLAFWQLLLFAVGTAVLTLLLVLPLYRRAQRLK